MSKEQYVAFLPNHSIQEAMENFDFPDQFMIKLTKIWTNKQTQSIFVKIEQLIVKINTFS